ncbi:MAG: DUF4349 domain-containing protein [Saprospiraceae bacterium]|nr:DUF4349 domain-containing protein [Saprospiraceae bacterium]
MSIQKLKFIVVMALFALVACHSKNSENENVTSFGLSKPNAARASEEADMAAGTEAVATLSEKSIQNVLPPKIIKNGTVEYEVSGLENAKSQLDKLLAAHKAYYENENFNAYGDRQSYTLVVRVPSSGFDGLLDQMNNDLGQLVSKSVHVDDVTESYYDVKMRMESELAYLDQYRAILKKAVSIKDILEIQEKIRVIEEEIESKKGRLRYLDDRADLSTLNVTLFEVRKQSSSSPNYLRRISNAFQGGINLMGNLFIALVTLWPVLLLIGLAFFLYRTYKRRKNASPPQI